VVEEKKVVVRFNGSWTKYFPGDIAGFEPFLAKQLLGMQMVDSKGNKSPLVSKYSGGSVLERIGITKGDKPVAEPIGGTDEKTVVDSGSSELVGGPAIKRGRGRPRKT
jgi:hypothetical protein